MLMIVMKIVMKITMLVMRMRMRMMMITTECITVQGYLKQHMMSARFRGGGMDEWSLAM